MIKIVNKPIKPLVLYSVLFFIFSAYLFWSGFQKKIIKEEVQPVLQGESGTLSVESKGYLFSTYKEHFDALVINYDYLLIFLVVTAISYCSFRAAFKYQNDIKTAFLILAATAGISYTLLNPPGRVPDEEAHWIRSFEISMGKFYSEKNELPASIDDIHFNNYSEVIGATAIELKPTSTKILSSGNALLYSPVPYLPQAIGVFLGRLINTKPLYLYYIGRLFNIAAYILLIYIGFTFIPFKKHLYFLLALTPMIIHQSASFSADALTNALAFLLIAYYLYLAYNENKEKILIKDLGVLLLICSLLALCKIVYLPLLLLFFLIPIKKFKSKTFYFVAFGVVALISSFFNLAWMQIASDYLINNPQPWASPKEQVHFILNQPFDYVALFAKTLNAYTKSYFRIMIGSHLGLLDLSIPKVYITLFTILTFLLAINNSDQKHTFTWFAKAIFVAVFFAVVLLIHTSLFIQWNEPGSSLIEGVQGRYFIPVSLILFLVFMNNKISIRYLNSERLNLPIIFFTVVVHFHVIITFINHHF